MTGLPEYVAVRERLRRVRARREARRREAWPFPPDAFVPASALLEADVGRESEPGGEAQR